MGADLIGYHYCGPKEFSEEVLSKAVALYDRFLSRIRHFEELEDDTSDTYDVMDTYFSVLKEYYKEKGIESVPTYFEDDAMNLMQAMNFDSGEDFTEALTMVWGGGGRDVSARYITVGEQSFSIVFAGERTWGDSPDGIGYQTFQAVSAIPGMEDLLGLF